MSYIISGALFAIGWFAVGLIYSILEELILCRLHRTNWYRIIAGGKSKSIKNSMDVKSVTNKIGF